MTWRLGRAGLSGGSIAERVHDSSPRKLQSTAYAVEFFEIPSYLIR